MRVRTAALPLVCTSVTACCIGCTSSASHPAGATTIVGLVALAGGPPAASGPRAGSGQVLAYRLATRRGTPVATAEVDPTGRFTMPVAPGTYYLDATAASYNGTACEYPAAVTVRAGAQASVDITCDIK